MLQPVACRLFYNETAFDRISSNWNISLCNRIRSVDSSFHSDLYTVTKRTQTKKIFYPKWKSFGNPMKSFHKIPGFYLPNALCQLKFIALCGLLQHCDILSIWPTLDGSDNKSILDVNLSRDLCNIQFIKGIEDRLHKEIIAPLNECPLVRWAMTFSWYQK